MEILSKHLEIRSFGLTEEEAAERTVYVLTKKERGNPDAVWEYALVFQDKTAAYKTRAQMSSSSGRYEFRVMQTIFSGPFNAA